MTPFRIIMIFIFSAIILIPLGWSMVANYKLGKRLGGKEFANKVFLQQTALVAVILFIVLQPFVKLELILLAVYVTLLILFLRQIGFKLNSSESIFKFEDRDTTFSMAILATFQILTEIDQLLILNNLNDVDAILLYLKIGVGVCLFLLLPYKIRLSPNGIHWSTKNITWLSVEEFSWLKKSEKTNHLIIQYKPDAPGKSKYIRFTVHDDDKNQLETLFAQYLSKI